MLARANSDAGNRLRRAKSSNSLNHIRSEPSEIPLDHYHAEVAAAEAFRRYSRYAASMGQAQRHLHVGESSRKKKRSSEGSHFEGSRNGARIGNPKAGQTSQTQTKKPLRKHVGSALETSSDMHEKTVITRQRRMVDTSTKMDPTSNAESTSKALRNANHQCVRKPKMSYEPTLTAGSLYLERLQSAQPSSDESRDLGQDNSSYHAQGGTIPTSIGICQIPRKSWVIDIEAERDLKANARDAHLQDFYKHKLRSKTSFIDPIRARLRKPSLQQCKPISLDASVPPFNSATDSDDVFASFSAGDESTALSVPKQRVTSESIKSRLKRMIGRGKRVQTALPIQHVTAKQYHFDLEGTNEAETFLVPMRPPPCPPMSNDTSFVRRTSSGTCHTDAGSHDARSRVTSWTNSTAVNTLRSLPSQQKRLISINEQDITEQNVTEASQKHGSFLGRALHLPLRQKSRADLQRSQEGNHHLYNALRKQIGEFDSLDRSSLEKVIDGSSVPREPVDVESKHSKVSTLTRKVDSSPASGQIIRKVSPDPPILDRSLLRGHCGRFTPTISTESPRPLSGIGSPPKILPPDPPSTRASPADAVNLVHEAPSEADWIARRYERSQNRWQSPLQAESPAQSRAIRCSAEDNPYELRSSQPYHQSDDLPMAVRHEGVRKRVANNDKEEMTLSTAVARGHVVSPSIYSRATADSTRPTTPFHGHGTIVKITARDIQTYTISPGRCEKTGAQLHRPRPSHELQSWLSGQLRDFESSPSPADLCLVGDDTSRLSSYSDRDMQASAKDATSGHAREHAQRCDSGGLVPRSKKISSPLPVIKPGKTRRPELSTRSSSAMNDRYPMIESGRKTSDKGLKALRHKVSESGLKAVRRIASSGRRTSSNNKRRDLSGEKAVELTDTRPSLMAENSPGKPSMLSRPRSMAYLVPAHRPDSSPIPTTATRGDEWRLATPRTASQRAKSALDLRARYRTSNSNLRDSSINIRRKQVGVSPTATLVPEQPRFDDQTLQKILDGPYAAELDEVSTHPSRSTQSIWNTGKENVGPAGMLSPVPGSVAGSSARASPAPFPSNVGGRNSVSPTMSRVSVRSSLRPESALRNRDRERDKDKESPGQRMAEGFLARRRERGNLGDLSSAFL